MPPKRYRKGVAFSPGKVARTTRAVEQVLNEKYSIRRAAREHGLSKDFLRRRLNGGVGIESRCGPAPIFTKEEEEAMAKWLVEMCKRGMGLTPGELLNFVENVIEKDKRQTSFTGNRPGRTWYYNFMGRNSHIIEPRNESNLEASRSKVTKETLDTWFEQFTTFVSDLNLMDKPERIFNADETGFTMGSKAGKVIGPTREAYPESVPHVSGGSTKARLTVMFCGNADGTLIPPFLVYPDPKPKAYDPLVGGITGSVVHYTKKGWMDNPTFLKFLEHFDKNAGDQRPVILLVDSCSSHISMEVFTFAKEKNIQIYRVVPNATHLMQPLDKGVFGGLKKEWYKVVRKNTKENPSTAINKQTFARHLRDAYMAFYKPATVASSFRASGIYPINRNAISNELLKPSLTFSGENATDHVENSSPPSPPTPIPEKQAAVAALEVFESVLTTPVRSSYKRRLSEGYDLTGSPGYEVFKKLKTKAESLPQSQCPSGSSKTVQPGPSKPVQLGPSKPVQPGPSKPVQPGSSKPVQPGPSKTVQPGPSKPVQPGSSKTVQPGSSKTVQPGSSKTVQPGPSKTVQPDSIQHGSVDSGLNVLAAAVELIHLHGSTTGVLASPVVTLPASDDSHDTTVSPAVADSLILPQAKLPPKRSLFMHQLPDCYTSDEAIRKSALRQLDTLRTVAKREQAAKLRFLKSQSVASSTAKPVRTKKAAATCSSLATVRNTETRINEPDVKCVLCSVWFGQDPEECEWVQCDECNGWLHVSCIAADHIFAAEALLPNSTVEFCCQLCV
jgi:hypothetical protein